MSSSDDLTVIPGVGPKMREDFSKIGVNRVRDLKGRNPEELFEKICLNYGKKIDRCVLYVCRCAVYFAENEKKDLEKLKWWNWKDSKVFSENLWKLFF